MKVGKTLLFTAIVLLVATAWFAYTLPRPYGMTTRWLWFVDPMHYLLILGWPVILLSFWEPLLALPIMAAVVIGAGALFTALWRRPHLSRWLYGGIIAWILTGTVLTWAEIVASI